MLRETARHGRGVESARLPPGGHALLLGDGGWSAVHTLELLLVADRGVSVMHCSLYGCSEFSCKHQFTVNPMFL